MSMLHEFFHTKFFKRVLGTIVVSMVIYFLVAATFIFVDIRASRTALPNPTLTTLITIGVTLAGIKHFDIKMRHLVLLGLPVMYNLQMLLYPRIQAGLIRGLGGVMPFGISMQALSRSISVLMMQFGIFIVIWTISLIKWYKSKHKSK